MKSLSGNKKMASSLGTHLRANFQIVRNLTNNHTCKYATAVQQQQQQLKTRQVADEQQQEKILEEHENVHQQHHNHHQESSVDINQRLNNQQQQQLHNDREQQQQQSDQDQIHQQQDHQQQQKCPWHQNEKKAALPFEDIPGPRPSLPLIGTNWIYFPFVGHYKSMKLHEANLDKYKRYGPIMKEEYQRGYPTVTIFDPADIKEVFMREGACPSRPVLDYVIKHRQSDPSRYPNVGLANMEGPEWFELRSRLAPLLLSRELKKRHISTQNRVSTRLVNYIKSLLPAPDINNNNNNNIDDDGDDDYLDSNSNNSGSNNIYSSYSNSFSRSSSNDSANINRSSGIVDNIQEVFYRFSMESIMNLCINQEVGCLKATRGDSSGFNNAITSDGENIFQAAMNFFEAQHKLYYGLGLWKYIDSKPYRQLRDSQNAIHDIASKYIDVALVHLKQKRDAKLRLTTKMMSNNNNSNNINLNDINNDNDSNLINSNEEHESLLETLYCTNKFNDLEIKSTIVDFVGGGIYTVANTLTMVLFLLASNPAVQEQLYQEICQAFPTNAEETGNVDEIIGDSSDINIDMEKLEQLKFLKLCLKESYRLLPTIPGVARTLQRDMVLSNYLVPKNTLVFCNFMVTCRLPQYFSEPDEYNPNRWERKDGKFKSSDLAFCLLPFGHGVRKCIGHNFAELEIYVALIKLIRSFKINTINGENSKSLNLCYKFIVVPEKPVTLQFTPRNRMTTTT